MRKDTKPNITPRIYSRDEHIVSRKNIDPDALKVMRRLMRNGYKAYLVGGAVRDLLLGKKPKDFDIATDATPHRVKSLFRNCRIIGRRFKLAHIYFNNGKILEVSTFRANHDEFTAEELNSEEIDDKDFILTDDNVYGDECSDALRRDITINALFYSLKDFSVIDYTGGMEDLRKGIVRVIGDPDVRFIEDPVRMLRTVRHSVRAGCKLDKSCISALENRQHLIEQCSAPRLYEEVRKDLTSGYLVEIFQAYSKHGLLQYLMPEIFEKSQELLDSHSLCGKALKKIDAYALSSGFETTTPIFATFAYFLACQNPTELNSLFSDKTEALDYANNCFKKLVIPRKEREHIADILNSIRVLSEENVSPATIRRIARNSSFNDLKLVLNFLNTDETMEPLLNKLEDVPKDNKNAKSNRSKGRPFYRNRSRRRN